MDALQPLQSGVFRPVTISPADLQLPATQQIDLSHLLAPGDGQSAAGEKLALI
ncbi:hypothetical protein ACTJJ4_10930 [Microbacterium sp. 22195]|uniref:hypothetical protein n=1 Tax=Microbacterium sp. 22195 TaxID=3453891 RepID=UPI003F84643A